MTLLCPYCGEETHLVTGDKLYLKRPDCADNFFYVCWDCNARVRCHPHTRTPLGSLANTELRYWRIKAHKLLDQRWQKISQGKNKKKRQKYRRLAYKWLGRQLNIDQDLVHIGLFDLNTCKKVVDLCEADVKNKISIKI